MVKRIGLVFSLFVVLFYSKAQVWTTIQVDSNASKPDVTVNNYGDVLIAYMNEEYGGYINMATLLNGSNVPIIDTVTKGYYYGPVSIALNNLDEPSIVFHEHNPGELGFAHRSNSLWTRINGTSFTHDGWDSDIVYDDNGVAHITSIDATGVGGGSGLHYRTFDGQDWNYDTLNTNRLPYGYATSLTIDQGGEVHIAYHDFTTGKLMYSNKSSGVWVLNEIDSLGAGYFAQIKLTSHDELYISYYQTINPNSGKVKLAFYNGTDWEISTVDSLYNVDLSFNGSRRMIDLILDNDDPIISYGDKDVVKIATINESSWNIDLVIDESTTGVTLGQCTNMAIDNSGKKHLVYYEVDLTKSPVMGNIMYSTTGVLTSISDAEVNSIDLFPNPIKSGGTLITKLDLKEADLLTILGTSMSLAIGVDGLQIPLSLEKGIYLLQLETVSGFRYTEKIFIE